MALDIIQLLDLTEGFDFEAKKAAGRDGEGQLPNDFFPTYSAMANTEGGTVLLGLEENEHGTFAVLGVQNPTKVIKELWDGLNNKEKVSVNTLANHDVRIIGLEGRRVIQITIPRATRYQLPVYLGKNPLAGTYRRRGEGDYLCDAETVRRMLREALVNLMIHADFTGRVSLQVVKRPELLEFRNPGLLRVPLAAAIRGGSSDCRNRNLQKMFQLVGLAEQAGSGLPKVYRNWSRQHWRRPELVEQLDPDQTILRLRMVSLLPPDTLVELDERFGDRFRELPETARLALATVAIEGSLTHARLKEMCADHPKDLSKALAGLVDDGFLVSRGATRATIYSFGDKTPTAGADGSVSTAAGSVQPAGASLPVLPSSSQHLPPSSQHLPPSSQHLPPSSQHLEELAECWPRLLELARPVSEKGKTSRKLVVETILKLCDGRFLTVKNLAELLHRDTNALLNHYLKAMLNRGVLELRFADKTHPQQAYRTKMASNP